jgi:hypothetical protein
MGKTVATLMKKPFFPVSDRTSPSVTPSTAFSAELVILTQLGSTGPRRRLKPHGLATSDRNTMQSLAFRPFPFTDRCKP